MQLTSKIQNTQEMGNKVLKQDIVEIIQRDAKLFGKVAYILNVAPVTLPRILSTNHKKLTHPPVLQVIKRHLGITDDSDLLTEMPSEKAVA